MSDRKLGKEKKGREGERERERERKRIEEYVTFTSNNAYCDLTK